MNVPHTPFFQVDPWGTRTQSRKANDDKSPLQKPIAACKTAWKALFDEFSIFGAGFIGGDKGENLRKTINSCASGSLTHWSFEYFEKPDVNGFEWKAHGRTIIGKKACHGQSIEKVGGPPTGC
jgi:hypothetical protein